jgi:hypothetical protein
MRLRVTKKLSRIPVSLILAMRSLFIGEENNLSSLGFDRVLSRVASLTVFTLIRIFKNCCWVGLNLMFPGWQ